MILYISSNDGSDVRITKEIQSLSLKTKIIYVGVGYHSPVNFAKEFCSEFYLIQGKRNKPWTVIRHFCLVLKLLLRKRIQSIHIINEQLMVFFYPLMFFKYVVLDLFDSFFLNFNKSGEKWKLIKRIVYLPCNRIIVTDARRKKLMPAFSQKAVVIVENYPIQYNGPWMKKSKEDFITIFYYGASHSIRGNALLSAIVDRFSDVRLIMAGWLTDESSRELVKQRNVDWRGVLTQAEIMRIAACEADYIMCMYKPVHESNIFASPNKLYEACQVKTPVITNSETVIADFVREHEIGIIFESFDVDPDKFISELREKRGKFIFSDHLVHAYSWEAPAQVLLKAHRL